MIDLSGVSSELLQYGALGAIALCSIVGTAWIVKGMRSDVHDMIQTNQKSNKAFTDYLVEQSRNLAEQNRQAYITNAGFVTALNRLTDRIDSIACVNRTTVVIPPMPDPAPPPATTPPAAHTD